MLSVGSVSDMSENCGQQTKPATFKDTGLSKLTKTLVKELARSGLGKKYDVG